MFYLYCRSISVLSRSIPILSVISDLSTVDLYMFYLDLERIFLNLYFLSPVFPFKAIVATFIITVF